MAQTETVTSGAPAEDASRWTLGFLYVMSVPYAAGVSSILDLEIGHSRNAGG